MNKIILRASTMASLLFMAAISVNTMAATEFTQALQLKPDIELREFLKFCLLSSPDQKQALEAVRLLNTIFWPKKEKEN